MSVLAYLSQRFSTHPENLATEALGYILQGSVLARQAVARFAESVTGRTLDLRSFETQASNEDRSRPDLIAVDADGGRPLFLEVKFWAGLTAAQPNGYLDALQQPGLVLFVAPGARVQTLWPELRARARAVRSWGQEKERGDTLWAQAGDHCLALTSWRTLLSHMRDVLLASPGGTADIDQLMALCDRMDQDAFLPLQSEELTSSLGRRVVQFGDLASELTDRLVRDGMADIRGLRAASVNGVYGRYLRLKGHGAFLNFSAVRWSRYGRSPLWLCVVGPDFQPSPLVGEALREAGVEVFPDLREAQIPILLPVGVEKEALIAAAGEQLRAVIDALPDALHVSRRSDDAAFLAPETAAI